MPRMQRIQYPGALYHVINRGNYRRDLFESVGEAEAFLATAKEAKERMGWKIHAYVLMRNHYHLAVETSEPTLVEGMHWLQCTWANRFNRFRKESGHLFQGRYRSILVQDMSAMGKVVDYIHLNPVRAGIVVPEQIKSYRWSSLAGIVKGESWVDGNGWQEDGKRKTADDPKAYEARLIAIGRDKERWEAEGLEGLSKGWALGTQGWKRAMAEEHGRLALNPGLASEEIRELREMLWEKELRMELAESGKSEAELSGKPYRQEWKLIIAERLQKKFGASVSWLAQRLCLGKASSLRGYLSLRRYGKI